MKKNILGLVFTLISVVHSASEVNTTGIDAQVRGLIEDFGMNEKINAGLYCGYCQRAFEKSEEESLCRVEGCQHAFHKRCYVDEWEKCWACMTPFEKIRAKKICRRPFSLGPVIKRVSERIGNAQQVLEGYFKSH